jgi:hypothetical protein
MSERRALDLPANAARVRHSQEGVIRRGIREIRSEPGQFAAETARVAMLIGVRCIRAAKVLSGHGRRVRCVVLGKLVLVLFSAVFPVFGFR